MANYARIFSVDGVAGVHRKFARAITLARELEATYARARDPRAASAGVALRELLSAYADFNRDLDKVAKDTAALARREIKAEIARTRKRPDTGNPPHLRDQIRARPLHRFGILATGEVGVADIDVLDQLVNPLAPNAGPYWRSQEYGYQFRGRQLTGVFGGFYTRGFAAGPFAPAPGPGVHPLFATRAQNGLSAGLVKFTKPIAPRRFIEKGANAAEAVWRAEVAAVERRYQQRIAAISP